MKNRIGIVGGGQLGRMITQEAQKMGYTVTVIDPTPDSPAAQAGAQQIIAHYNDHDAIRKLADVSDVITFEIELANADVLDELAQKGVDIHPSAKTLEIIKDKLLQKQFLKKAHIPVAEFVKVEDKKDIKNAAQKFGYPILLKARFDAYDGRGNALIKNEKQITRGMKKLAGRKLYVEKFVPFVKELAVMTARNTNGEIKTYDVVETIQKNNICHIVKAPAEIDRTIMLKAKKLAEKTMQHLQGAGVFGIEMFLTKDGKVYLNEIAPRVHNSGHYTIEGNHTSQFAQHIHAITGNSLQKTTMQYPAAVMINILGSREGKAEPKGIEDAEKIPGIRVHMYGKLQTKPERKMGHLTATGKTVKEALSNAKKARKLISI